VNILGTGNRGYSPSADSNSSSSIGAISNSNKNKQGQDQKQKQAQGQMQGQGQLGIVSPTQSVGGDTQKNTAYVLTAPNTVAGQGQQASSVYSIFGGVNMAQTAEYQICREKIDVIKNMEVCGYLSKEEALAEARDAFNQLKDNTQVKRILWIGPKTRGVHLGNAFGILAMDSCNEINTDNWMGLKSLTVSNKEEVSTVRSESKVNFGPK
jgi:hypothetical protein